jgi:hypothetical protein
MAKNGKSLTRYHDGAFCTKSWWGQADHWGGQRQETEGFDSGASNIAKHLAIEACNALCYITLDYASCRSDNELSSYQHEGNKNA